MCMKKTSPFPKSANTKESQSKVNQSITNQTNTNQPSHPLPPLTSKEKAVLQFLEKELLDKGISPSYQEICNHFGLASFNSVQNYLKQLTQKGYLVMPHNQKRAIQILHSANAFQTKLSEKLNKPITKEPLRLLEESSDLSSPEHESSQYGSNEESKVLSIPFLGKVAAGQPIEKLSSNEFLKFPINLINSKNVNINSLFALQVEGESMIDEGIFDGDFLIVQSSQTAENGELVVATIVNENSSYESTVKRFYNKTSNNSLKNRSSQKNQVYDLNNESNDYFESNLKTVELRPSNSKLSTMWFHPKDVKIQGHVKALFRKY